MFKKGTIGLLGSLALLVLLFQNFSSSNLNATRNYLNFETSQNSVVAENLDSHLYFNQIQTLLSTRKTLKELPSTFGTQGQNKTTLSDQEYLQRARAWINSANKITEQTMSVDSTPSPTPTPSPSPNPFSYRLSFKSEEVCGARDPKMPLTALIESLSRKSNFDIAQALSLDPEQMEALQSQSCGDYNTSIDASSRAAIQNEVFNDEVRAYRSQDQLFKASIRIHLTCNEIRNGSDAQYCCQPKYCSNVSGGVVQAVTEYQRQISGSSSAGSTPINPSNPNGGNGSGPINSPITDPGIYIDENYFGPFDETVVEYKARLGQGPGNYECEDNPNDSPDCGTACPGSYAYDVCKADGDPIKLANLAREEWWNRIGKHIGPSCRSSADQIIASAKDLHEEAVREINFSYDEAALLLKEDIRLSLMQANELSNGIIKAINMKYASKTVMILARNIVPKKIPFGVKKTYLQTRPVWIKGTQGYSRVYGVTTWGAKATPKILGKIYRRAYIRPFENKEVINSLKVVKKGYDVTKDPTFLKVLLSACSEIPLVGGICGAVDGARNLNKEAAALVNQFEVEIKSLHQQAESSFQSLKTAKRLRDQEIAKYNQFVQQVQADVARQMIHCTRELRSN